MPSADGPDTESIAMVDFAKTRSGTANLPAPPQETTGLRRRFSIRRAWTHHREQTINDRNRLESALLNVESDELYRQRRRSSAVDMEMVAELLEKDHLDTDTHGISEIRDGWFDAVYLKQRPLDYQRLMRHAESTLPAAFAKDPPLSLHHFLPKQRRQLRSVFFKVMTTRSGVRLFKASLAFFIAYCLCLVPQVREWLGRYNYIMVVSVIINHPARPMGPQLDGTILTILGTISGLAWGVIGLILSYSTVDARTGYGAILALFFSIFIACVAYIRAYWTRFYQFSISAGIAMCYSCLAEVNGEQVRYIKFWSYGIPWILGQAISLVVNLAFLPDAGSRALAETLHEAFFIMQDALEIPRPRNVLLRRSLARVFVAVGVAYRDLRLDVSFTRYNPVEVRELRNLIQGVIRSILLLKTETRLFESWDLPEAGIVPVTVTAFETIATDVDGSAEASSGDTKTMSEDDPDTLLRLVALKLAAPTEDMLLHMRSVIRSCDAALMDMSGYRSALGPPKDEAYDVDQAKNLLRKAIDDFDQADQELQLSGVLPDTRRIKEVSNILVFTHHIRGAAGSIDTLGVHVSDMKQSAGRPKFYLPTYSLHMAINYANAQIRRDRGGVSASNVKMTFDDITTLIEAIQSREHRPAPRSRKSSISGATTPLERSPTTMEAEEMPKPESKHNKFGYQIWRILHRLQGFESKYALKVCMLTALLAIPAWLEKSRSWWNLQESWWAVVMAWVMVHPRIGGNMQDLLMRALCVTLGAVWAGVAYAARNGNPYVMAVFALIYMLPMLYRFTQSSHPRSGIAGCLSFSVISLALVTADEHQSAARMAATRGLAFLVGTVSAVMINWILWPFVSRHELRKALSSMLFFQSVLYRGVLSKYVYYEEQKQPTKQDIERSEMLEGRLREGFVRIRQLLIMTRHELRLRSPFDPLPYSALADACENFFEHLIAVRQAALNYDPGYVRDNDAAAEKLLSYRRDAVACILSNLYILAGALKSDRKVPRYLPSAAVARKRLLDRMAEIEAEELAAHKMHRRSTGLHISLATNGKWAQVYGFAFNESLTGCVAQLEELERYTKLIVGEQGFDDEFRDDDSDTSDEEEDERIPHHK
ncbi:Protein BRE4 like protein [Verticillium longisporum]|nr:Protein BRE4 like protein [Verticillium longisporum]